MAKIKFHIYNSLVTDINTTKENLEREFKVENVNINPISGKSYYSVSFSKEDISVDGVRKALQRLQLLCDNPDIQIN